MTARLIAIAYGCAGGWFAVEAADHLVAGRLPVAAIGILFGSLAAALALDYWPGPLMRRRGQ